MYVCVFIPLTTIIHRFEIRESLGMALTRVIFIFIKLIKYY